MPDIFRIAPDGQGLTNAAVAQALTEALAAWTAQHGAVRRALIIPPDFTRYHSNAGFITETCHDLLTRQGAAVDVMPALGTHMPVSAEQWRTMFGAIPYDRMIVHNWRTDVVRLGDVPADVVAELSGGLWREPVDVEVNRRLMDETYDLIVSPGQVVPHEVIGMANHAKNVFVGCGGADMINKSHMIGAVCGMEKAMGRDHTPVRRLFDYAFERYMAARPILWVLTVNTAPQGDIVSHGLFIGTGRQCLTEAVKLAQKRNIDYVERGLRKCVVYLDPREFSSTWLGNKAIYRTRMAMADGGDLIILAPGVRQFGEDKTVDGLIRKYGYRGRLNTLEAFRRPDADDLRANMGAAAHLIHGSSDGRFRITYAVRDISQQEIADVGFAAADYATMAARYDPTRLRYGYNDVAGEEIYFIPNPALGLWIDRSRFQP